jgi:hypothetical protein
MLKEEQQQLFERPKTTIGQIRDAPAGKPFKDWQPQHP